MLMVKAMGFHVFFYNLRGKWQNSSLHYAMIAPFILFEIRFSVLTCHSVPYSLLMTAL